MGHLKVIATGNLSFHGHKTYHALQRARHTCNIQKYVGLHTNIKWISSRFLITFGIIILLVLFQLLIPRIIRHVSAIYL